MKKPDLPGLEKRNFRNEVKGIKKELKDSGKGVYLFGRSVHHYHFIANPYFLEIFTAL
jgi:hypothetical protein